MNGNIAMNAMNNGNIANILISYGNANRNIIVGSVGNSKSNILNVKSHSNGNGKIIRNSNFGADRNRIAALSSGANGNAVIAKKNRNKKKEILSLFKKKGLLLIFRASENPVDVSHGVFSPRENEFLLFYLKLSQADFYKKRSV